MERGEWSGGRIEGEGRMECCENREREENGERSGVRIEGKRRMEGCEDRGKEENGVVGG